MNYIKENLLLERERWLLWLPVFFGVGIGIYFGLPVEPSVYWVLLLLPAAALLLRRNYIAVIIFAVVAGFSVSKINAEMVKGPVKYYSGDAVTISGNIAEITSSNGFPVLILENLRIDEFDKIDVPEQLRLGVRTRFKQEVRPGDRIITDAVISAPSRPPLPGGYDFARGSYFNGADANGFAVKQIIKLKNGGQADFMENIRYKISEKIRASLPGDTGAMTDAVVTGDRSRLSQAAYNDMRKSGLAHLIAISGINMVLAAGVMFFGVRFLLSLNYNFSERYPVKKISAIVAILGLTAYLFISGMPVSAVRSYIMVLLIMLAILSDRAATPMRSVGFSAIIILIFAPASMLGPSFQMSYAATCALISVYEIFARYGADREEKMFTDDGIVPWYKRIWNKLWLYPVTVLGTSLVAGLATAPYSAYHFNQFVNYGLLANLAAIPLTSFIVMPFIVIGLVLMPFGLQDIGLIPAGWGTYWTLWIANRVGNLDNSAVLVPQIATWGLVLITLGGLWFLIWQRKWRYWGFVLILAGLLSPLGQKFPDIMIHENGRLFAINYQGKLYFSNGRNSFAAKSWLKYFAQDEQVKLPKQDVYDLGAYKFYIDSGDCSFLVKGADSLCVKEEDLKNNGTYNIYLKDRRIDVETVEERRGKRPWTEGNVRDSWNSQQ